MSDSIRGFKISGKKFDPFVNLELFPKDATRLAVLFGKNGEGKSTISGGIRAFGPTQNRQLGDVAKVELLDANGDAHSISDTFGSSVHVFNESFIDEKVRIKDSGLEAIVMLGNTGDIEDTITDLKEEIKTLNSELSNLKEEEEEYSDINNPKSPEFHWLAAREQLSRLWAVRQKDIKGNHQKSPITNRVVDEFLAAEKPSETQTELDTYVKSAIKQLKDYSDNENCLLPPITLDASKLQIDEGSLINLLAQKIENPNPTPRDRLLLNVLKKYGNGFINQAQEYFNDPQTNACPYCLRKIDSQEKASVLETIKKTFNSIADDHKAKLENALMPELDLQLDVYSVLNKTTINNVKNALNNWNEVILKTNSLIQKKLNDIYTPIVIQSLGFNQAQKNLTQSIQKLNTSCDIWNKGITNKKQLSLDAQEANKKLAWYEIEKNSQTFQRQQAKKTKLISQITEKNNSISQVQHKLAKIELSKKNEIVALDTINKDLAFIFLDANRLVLEGNDGEYRLLVHGKPVRPDSISSGERNAVGLCYFFSLIATGKEKGQEFKQPLLLIIDDPISSFDYENEIAILSYLVEKVKCVLQNNPSSKVVIMTHNRQVMHQLSRLDRDFGKKYVCYLKLQNGAISQWEDKDLDYKKSVNWLYTYACDPSDDKRNYAGNIARKTIEAYSTFQYSMGFSRVMQDQKILQSIQPESVRPYFHRRLTKIILNWESHTEDVTNAEGDIAANPQYNDETIDRAVRDVLCFIFKINEKHLLSHIDDPLAKEKLNAWCHDIESLC